jgi:hypothetical protein
MWWQAWLATSADCRRWPRRDGGRRPSGSGRGYGVSEASTSQRRASADELANAEARRELSNDPVESVNEDGLPAANDRTYPQRRSRK